MPGYSHSASPKKLTEDLDQARLDEQARLIKQRIAEYEHRRKDLAVLEVIESTIKQPVPIWERFGFLGRSGFAIPTLFSCIRTRKCRRIPDDFQGREQTASTSSHSSTGVSCTGKIDAKKLMLQNEQRIQWSKNLQVKVRGAMSLRRKLHSPVYAISQDLWGYIFLFFLPDPGQGDNKAGDEYVEPDRNSAPLLLCGVCHTWRIAAISTPAL
ncbi:hypothetical protein NLJ89_g7129 [Agrocybe chaxingu]|uniref:Uncharacterized protein n=1 Tax=Agrocybe chaxingu TaxID=84603 RepID=A0A9W8MVC4_9AGAR|nr:hypothetical protein NLJ89_g7129 [Agrocybe chaxingu]